MANQTEKGSGVNTALREPTTTEIAIIDVGRDFTRYPAGRDKKDGPFCGEIFRQRFLEPRLAKRERVIVNLDSALSYGSSFLEEAFGGLIRLGYGKDLVLSLVDLKTEDPILKEEILDYVNDATPP